MSVALVAAPIHRPVFQMIGEPIKRIYSVFLLALGSLFLFLGAKEWGKKLQIKGQVIENRLQGVWAFGKRFMVVSVNLEQKCRGMCYWLIDQHLRHREKPLAELARAFESGTPPAAILMHDQFFVEQKLWSVDVKGEWPEFTQLPPGVYTFLIGFSKDLTTPSKAHRIAFFNQPTPLLFDPSVGLSQWEQGDWKPLLSRIAKEIQISPVPPGFFTIECYSY